MKLNINDLLDDLILKYNIDRNNSRFSKMKKAQKLLTTLFNHINKCGLLLIADKYVDIEFVREHVSLSDIDYVIVDIDKEEDFNQDKLNTCKHAVIVSFYWHRELFSELKRRNINAISIYNYFLENGLEINHVYYDIFGQKHHNFYGEKSESYDDFDINSNIFSDLRCYQLEENRVIKKIYLEKLIFDCVYIKDFISTKKYIHEYINHGYDYENTYKYFHNEVEILLATIKKVMSNNRNRNIIMFWLDSLEYGEDKGMPFLSELSKKGIVFEHAYTVTPFTHFAIKTIFLKKNAVDDKSYNIKTITQENSATIKYLKESGYDFIYYGFSKQFDENLKDNSFINRYSTASTIYWNMLSNLVGNDSDKLTFNLVHEIMETHSPFLSPAIADERYLYKEFNSIEEVEYRNKNYAPISRKYLDDLLRFYNDLIGEHTCNIFMSDHGHTPYGRFHTVLNITGPGIVKRNYKQLFSYYNFDNVIRYIVELDETILTNSFSEYVRIQDVDYYNKKAILRSLNKNRFGGIGALGYRGVITEKDMMICYNNGHKEYFQLYNEVIKDERLEYLMNLIGEDKIDIYQDDHFKYSRYVYKALENYQNRVGKLMDLKISTLCKLLDEIPEEKKIAIRCGGENTRRLFWSVGYERRNRISYIIDQSKDCISSKLGIPVILPDEMEEKGIDVIIISCFPLIPAIMQEMEKLDTQYDIIDMYDYLRNNGIKTDCEFYIEPYADSDFNFTVN